MEPAAAGEEEKSLPVSWKWRQRSARAHVSQLAPPLPPMGTIVLVFSGRYLRTRLCCWESEDHNGFNDEATWQVALTWDPPRCPFPLVHFYALTFIFLQRLLFVTEGNCPKWV